MSGDRDDGDGQRDRGDPSDRGAVLGIVAEGLETPPVGVVLLELLVDAGDAGRSVDRDAFYAEVREWLERETSPRDIVVLSPTGRLTIVKPGLTAPAEAEGSAIRLRAALGSKTFLGHGRVSCRASIGVAVSRRGDTAENLVRYAEHALGDARMLGGDMVVAFDDQDRDLLAP